MRKKARFTMAPMVLLALGGACAPRGLPSPGASKSGGTTPGSSGVGASGTPAPELSEPSAAEASPATPLNDPARVAEWQRRLELYYSALERDAGARHSAFQALFAAKLERFLTLERVTRAAALASVDRFFSMRERVAYDLKAPPKLSEVGGHTRLEVRVDARWSRPAPEAWVDQVPQLAEAGIDTALELTVTLEANVEQRVVWYDERRLAPKPLSVLVACRGYSLPFVEGCWGAPGEFTATELPVATLVEPTSDSVPVVGCGPPTSTLLVEHAGRRLWVVQALWELVPNPNGGSSIGGTLYLDSI